MKSGIYEIVNTVNGKHYYGSATNFGVRFSTHKYYLNKGTSRCVKLQHAWNKYGEAAFVFNILILCAKKDLLFYEQRVLDGMEAVKTGYNICGTAGSALGLKRSSEAIEKTAAFHRGKKLSEEHLRKLSEAKKGKKLSPEHIENVRLAITGLKRDAEFCKKLGDRSRGTVTSEATKEKQRLAALNRDSSKGTNNVNAKMDAEKVLRIRELYAKGQALTAIARTFQLHPSTVGDIAKRLTWRHVA